MNICLLFLWHLAICLRAAFADDNRSAAPSAPPEYDEAIDNGTYDYYPTRAYATVGGLTSPRTNYLQWDARCDDGLFNFVTPRGWSLPEPGPMILDNKGDLIWSQHFEGKSSGQAYDFRVQEYRGQDYLTFWLGDDRVRGHGSGFYYMSRRSHIWDCLFQEVDVATGELVFEWRASEHVPINETYHIIGPGGTKDDPFDWFHINSIQKDDLGNYLISARYTHSITYIDGQTGDIIWTLGGHRNDFMDMSNGFAINFAWQHDARLHPIDMFPNLFWPPSEKPGYQTQLLTMFDNANEDQHYDYGMTYSRGLLLALTYPTTPDSHSSKHQPETHLEQSGDIYTEAENNFNKLFEINGTNPDYSVRLLQSYVNPHLIHSSSQGSLQVLPQPGGDPKILVGYGLNAAWTEFDADGTVLCDVHFGAETSFERGDVQSYRAYKFAWTGTPETAPALEISDDDVEVYVSWNGATDVVDWVLQCSETVTEDDEAWADVAQVEKDGFETVIPLPEDAASQSRYLRVIALTTAGRRLDYGISRTIDREEDDDSYFSITASGLKAQVASLSPTKVFIIVASITGGVFLLYEGYRRYLSWKTGRPGGGPLMRWRPGGAYKLLAGSPA
ncbi:hypothetical protein LTR78_006903 [Recurvomyces mirabilis]|uniref:Arylsulfotransferase n=1 Tax=Recurvomyces mirabilis TaxID=574656 RepID=A0AAE1BZJ3_9PEZI|nr:hypothetical protein LTR78_006903 [Recurvomyces mirabilis]KAK5153106.1 hypothetical protein LTS14_007750 [Recurvomyces mirabilis]